MAAQAFPPEIRHSKGRWLLERIIIINIARKLKRSASQNRRMIRGISLMTKLCNRSTSIRVAPHVILYEKRCASRAWDKWIEMPPNKKKLWTLMRHEKTLE